MYITNQEELLKKKMSTIEKDYKKTIIGMRLQVKILLLTVKMFRSIKLSNE